MDGARTLARESASRRVRASTGPLFRTRLFSPGLPLSRINARIEAGFERLGRFLFRHRVVTVLSMAALVAGLVSQLPRIRFDTSTEGLFHKNDPAIVDYNAFRDQFGRDELVVVAVNPPDVFDIAFLERLREFHKALESEVPHLDDITSLINARLIRGEGDTLAVEDLLRELPRDSEKLAALRDRVLQHPFYPNQFISADGKVTTIVMKTNAFTVREGDSDLLGGFEAAPSAGDLGPRARPALTDQ